MQKDRSYHEAAIKYNDELAEFADELSERLDHEEVARWARSVAKQHKFHAGRHRKALAKMDAQKTRTVNTEDGGEDRVVDDEHVTQLDLNVDDKPIVVHKSAVDGEFVSAAEAEANPDTTYETTVAHRAPEAPAPAGEQSAKINPQQVPAADGAVGEEA